MPDPAHTAIAEVAAAIGAATVAGAVGLMKLLERFKSTERSVATTNAELDVINSLRVELTRLAGQNTELAKSLNELQLEVFALRAENAQLRVTIRELTSQVGILHVDKGVTGE